MSSAKPIALQNQGKLCLHKMSVTSCAADGTKTGSLINVWSGVKGQYYYIPEYSTQWGNGLNA